MKTILLTGSEGSVGKYILSNLYKSNLFDSIIRVKNSKKTFYDKKLNMYYGNLLDKSFCKNIFKENNISHIIHCAAKWNGINKDLDVFYNNFISFNNILNSFENNIEKFIFISSSAVYSNKEKNEDSELQFPQSTYGISKLFSEKLLIENSKKYKYTIYRPFHIVSPNESYNFGSSHVTTDLLHRLIEKNEILDFNSFSDDHYIGFTWVEDFAKAIVNNISNSKTNNEIFNIGTSKTHSLMDLIYQIVITLNNLNIKKFSVENFNSSHKIIQKYDNSFLKIKDKLDWSAQTDFENCVRNFIKEKYYEN